MQAFKLCLHSLCVEHTQMSLYFQLRHMPTLQPKTIFALHVLHGGVLSTKSPGTGPVL